MQERQLQVTLFLQNTYPIVSQQSLRQTQRDVNPTSSLVYILAMPRNMEILEITGEPCIGLLRPGFKHDE